MRVSATLVLWSLFFFSGALSLPSGISAPTPATAEQLPRVYLAVDKAQILDLGEPARKVAVANPSIADVQVINPSQLLLNGKGIGVTSLVVFSAKTQRSFDLVVHPGPLGGTSMPSPTTDPHNVLVQRGDKMSEQFFTRDKDQHWLELGHVKLETDTGKK
jgi:hypothetical protein